MVPDLGSHVLTSTSGGWDIKKLSTAILNGQINSIITMAGAGISVSAGIPDFRSENGIFEMIRKSGIHNSDLLFHIDFFKKNPIPFYLLCQELLPGKFKPTKTHFFVRLLELKGLLLRHYTQNIDTLDRLTGISPSKLVEAHGSFTDYHCVRCGARYPISLLKDTVECASNNEPVQTCFKIFGRKEYFEKFHQESPSSSTPKKNNKMDNIIAVTKLVDHNDSFSNSSTNTEKKASSLLNSSIDSTNDTGGGAGGAGAMNNTENMNSSIELNTSKIICGGYLKPSIVFYGENLPIRFHKKALKDTYEADLVIVMGTSLKVMPFASLMTDVRDEIPRLLINRDPVGIYSPDWAVNYRRYLSVKYNPNLTDPQKRAMAAIEEESDDKNDSDVSDGFVTGDQGFRFYEEDNERDMFFSGEVDNGVDLLCELLGWTEELNQLMDAYEHVDAFKVLEREQEERKYH